MGFAIFLICALMILVCLLADEAIIGPASFFGYIAIGLIVVFSWGAPLSDSERFQYEKLKMECINLGIATYTPVVILSDFKLLTIKGEKVEQVKCD